MPKNNTPKILAHVLSFKSVAMLNLKFLLVLAFVDLTFASKAKIVDRLDVQLLRVLTIEWAL
jgi:hypothetical protein